MQSWRTLFLLALSGAAAAQADAPPHEAIHGASVPAHHVRLEGSAFPDQAWNLARHMQRQCAEKMGKPVSLPPPDTVLQKVVEDVYYTETHLITFKKSTTTAVTTQCELGIKTIETIDIQHPHGHCKIKPANKTAIGQCANHYTGSAVTTAKSKGQTKVLGFDAQAGCNRMQFDVARTQSTICTQSTKENWPSLQYRGTGEFAGLRLAHKIVKLPEADVVLWESKAVQVEKNIQIGRDMLNLASSRGYKIVEVGGRTTPDE